MKYFNPIVLVFAVWLPGVGVAVIDYETDRDTRFLPIAEGEHEVDEFLDWRSARVNGKLSLLTTKELLVQIAGQADSLVTPTDDICVSFYDKPFKYGYFNGISVELYGDTAVITSLDFTSNAELFLESPVITLSHNTSFGDVQSIFPRAVNRKREADVLSLGKVTSIRLMTAKDPTDDAWLLFFRDDKLIRIDYWMSC